MKPVSRVGDRIFSGVSSTIAVLLAILVLVILAFLVWHAVPALSDNSENFFTSRKWATGESPQEFGIAALLWTTLISSLLALLLAVPLAVGIALFITHYAPRRLAQGLGYIVDLLAAVPSVVYGLWGLRVFGPFVQPLGDALSGSFLGKIPLFAPGLSSSGTMFATSLVLAIMILPIITALSRDVFDQTPRDHIEAAWALGSTKWEMIKTAVIPYGRSGVVAASMLGATVMPHAVYLHSSLVNDHEADELGPSTADSRHSTGHLSRLLRATRIDIYWALSIADVLPDDGLAPFLIDWGTTPHPAGQDLPRVELLDLRLTHPDADRLNSLYADLGLGLRATVGRPGLSATLRGPGGELVLS